MARVDLIKMMYSKNKTPLEFKFDSLYIPSMYNYLTIDDIVALYKLASSVALSSKIKYKYAEIDRILTNRGFKKLHAGTNRVAYSYIEDQSFVLKVAIDKVGMNDNPAEYKNQFILQPFITKIFEVSPCGTVATVERVEPITSRHEFLAIAEDVFDLINNKLIGEYVLEDIGSDYFMNWGIRPGFGPVLLDFPYLFPLDGNKLFCNKPIIELGEICGGVIDYDIGYNNLICTKCGKRYLATELQKYKDERKIIFTKGADETMKVSIRKGKEVIKRYYDDQSKSDTIKPREQFERDMDIKGRGRGSKMYDYLSRAVITPNGDQGKQQDVKDNIVTTASKFIPPPVKKEIKLNVPKTEDSIIISQSEADSLPYEKGDKIVGKYGNKGITEQIDELKKFGLSDKDFEEPTDETVTYNNSDAIATNKYYTHLKKDQDDKPSNTKDMSDY